MLKVMKFDGSVVEMVENTKTYDWTSGEVEYDLVYDGHGDLFGVVADGIEKEILDDIVERPYGYDFPSTLDEYVDNDLDRLKILVGKEFDYYDVICAMTDIDEEVIVSKIEGYTSNFEGHGECQLYNTYYNMKHTVMYRIWVDSDNIIVTVG